MALCTQPCNVSLVVNGEIYIAAVIAPTLWQIQSPVGAAFELLISRCERQSFFRQEKDFP
jgi:hypothetical protein